MVTSHIYSVFDDELKHLARRIAEMGGMAEQMVSDSIRALVTSDAALRSG
jgi:phosphate transport system protein